jgi:uncharacterized protein
MYKLSIYNYTVKYQNNIILYNSLSNILFVLLSEEYSHIQELFKHLNDFEENYSELFNSFIKGGFIIDDDFSEIEYIKIQNKKKIFSDTDYHITINPTLDCNVACWYCSVKEEKAQYKDTIMSPAIVCRINLLLRNKIFNDHSSSFHIAWFGGEPTKYYHEVMKPICSNLKNIENEKAVEIIHSITTNATLLDDEILTEMQNFNFKSFQIPIDGNRERHNIIKHTSGSGT